MKASYVQFSSLLVVGVAVFASIVVFGVYQQEPHSADAVVEPRATAAQVNELCEQTEKALREIAKYSEPHPPDLMNCEAVALATSESP